MNITPTRKIPYIYIRFSTDREPVGSQYSTLSGDGFSEWPAHQMHIRCWNNLADQYGFIVVYPSGTEIPLRWRLKDFSKGSSVQPVEFAIISGLIDHLFYDRIRRTDAGQADAAHPGI